MTIVGTKWEKFTHYAKIVIITGLVFTAGAALGYSHMQDKLAAKDKEILKVQLVSAQEEIQTLKASVPR